MANTPARAAYRELLALYEKHVLVAYTAMFLEYDAAVYMPGSAHQDRSTANFSVMQHNNKICREANRMYQMALPGVDRGEFDRQELANLREAQRALNVGKDMDPADAQAYGHAVQTRMQISGAFRAAKPRIAATQDFKLFSKMLADSLRAAKEEGRTLCRHRPVYDNLIMQHAFGLTFADVQAMDQETMSWWPSLFAKAAEAERRTDELRGPVLIPKPFDPSASEEASRKLFRECLTMLKFDWNRGRIDCGPYGFTNPPSWDTRVVFSKLTTSPLEMITTAMHEGGHGIYEQGIPATMWRRPIGVTDCKAFHEGHSHFIEMNILRDPGFVDVASHLLRDAYGDDPAFECGNLKRLFSRVVGKTGEDHASSGIRSDFQQFQSVMVSTILESELVAGTLQVNDLPARLIQLNRERFGKDLTETQAKQQLMQMVQWYQTTFGYISIYTFGILYASQFGEAIRRDLGNAEWDNAMRTGVLSPVVGWFTDKVWRHGHVHETMRELVEEATGSPVTTRDHRAFLERRYAELSA